MTRRHLVPLVCVALAAGISCAAAFALPAGVTHNDGLAADAAMRTLAGGRITTSADGLGPAATARTANAAASPAPTAAFTYSPSSPSTGQSVSFNGSASTCSATPCSYTWADDPPSGGSWPLGSGQTMSFTFKVVGTKYVHLTVTDALNHSTTVEHDVVVSAAATPAAPTNTAVPAVSGTAQQGDTLTTTNGSWSGSPTGYAYAWEDCNTSGASCTSISGATSSSYTLASSDLGDTIRSVVTATNADGSTPASSAPTAAVSQPPAPTAAFTYSPSSPSTGQSVSFNGSASTCSATPCSYTWADDPPSGGSWPLGSGQTMSFTFKVVGTKYVHLTVTDALNHSTTVEHDVVVSAAATPAAPTNTAVPAVSGTAQQGDTLTTSNGSWSGSPTGYAYAWEDCNTSGASCTSISGATSSSYTLASSDLGDTIRSVVTATNAGGANSANSAQTATVTSATPAAPTNTAVPAVSGTAQQGDTLTTSNGSWSGSPTGYAYAWEDCNTSGASCTSISGATSSSYTLASSDVGDTIRSVVTATNAGGANSANSAQTATVTSSGSGDPPPGQLTCNLSATTSNYASQISAASPGQVVCLASGDYSGFTGTSKASPGVTITSAPGAAVTFNSGMSWNMSGVQNFTLDGTGGGGTMTVGGTLDMETSQDAEQVKALNITIQNIAFKASNPSVIFQGPEQSNVTFNRDTFVAGNSSCPAGYSGIFYVINAGSSTTQTGLDGRELGARRADGPVGP